MQEFLLTFEQEINLFADFRKPQRILFNLRQSTIFFKFISSWMIHLDPFLQGCFRPPKAVWYRLLIVAVTVPH